MKHTNAVWKLNQKKKPFEIKQKIFIHVVPKTSLERVVVTQHVEKSPSTSQAHCKRIEQME